MNGKYDEDQCLSEQKYNKKWLKNFSKHADEEPCLPLTYIVKLENTFTDSENINFVFEYLQGPDLYWLIQNQMHIINIKNATNKKDWILFYATQLLCAIETLHKFNIIYRDIKPENVIISSHGNIKLIDFGFAKILSPSSDYRTYTNCGTLGYTAPEILLGTQSGYSFEVDIWSYGILLCELF